MTRLNNDWGFEWSTESGNASREFLDSRDLIERVAGDLGPILKKVLQEVEKNTSYVGKNTNEESKRRLLLKFVCVL